MSMIHSSKADAFTPEDFGGLVNLAVQAKSIAAQSATVFSTNKHKVNFPLWTADPSVAWYNELDTIAATDGTTDEVECTPLKTAGLVLICNELRDDSDPLSRIWQARAWRTRSPVQSTPRTSRTRPPRVRAVCSASPTPRSTRVPASPTWTRSCRRATPPSRLAPS
jgi:hypothetical protein